MTLLANLAPELILITVACVLFFLGTVAKPTARRLSATLALLSLVSIFAWQLSNFIDSTVGSGQHDDWNTLWVGGFATFINMIVSGVGALLILLAWPGNADATGSPSMNAGAEIPEFFALALLSLSGVMLVAGANDIILLFLGIELAAIPTYIMVSISRPLPVAQEAGVKYFFLGAMAAAVMLFGFSYVYGATGSIKLNEISAAIPRIKGQEMDWYLLLGVLMLLAGFAYKIAAVPFHTYAGDVYQGAATPVTAFLAFVPKTSGFVAIIKLLAAVGGSGWSTPELVVKVLWVVAVLTMTVGNVLGLIQQNVKRVFAYSSIAHSGYMLVGITALVSASQLTTDSSGASVSGIVQREALQGVLFYLMTYGLMNVGAFGVLMLLPSRGGTDAYGDDKPQAATTAETFEDLAGQGRKHPILGIGLAICCFSLIGLPVTVGFFGKYFLILPALKANLFWLVVLTMVNAAVSAAYYLKIVATLFIRPAPAGESASTPSTATLMFDSAPLSIGAAIGIVATLILGLPGPWIGDITNRIGDATPSVVESKSASTPVAIQPEALAPQASAK